MNKIERLILYNQYEILKHLNSDDDDKEYYQGRQDILENGFESEYDTLTSWFGEVPVEICNEVKNILQMFRDLGDSYIKLNDKSGISEYEVKFRGFDGNEEIKHYTFAKWYITEERFSEFLECDMNSHMNVLNQYRKMYSRYVELLQYKNASFFSDFTNEEICYIIGK